MFENMGAAILGCTFVLGALVIYERRKAERTVDRKNQAYWSREDHSNTVRKKDITFLPYITIPLDRLPMSTATDDEEIAEYIDTTKILSGRRVIDLSSMSNTDLKEEYGIANLPQLSEYDENYTTLVNTLTRWGARLIALEHREEAVQVLEYAISIGCNISRCYYMLAQEYRRIGTPERIDTLIELAENADSLLKESIVAKLKELRES